MTKTQAMKKLIQTGKLSTDLLKPLGISFESFLRLAQRSDADAIQAKLVEKYKRELEADRLAKKAKKALDAGDVDEAFDLALSAVNKQDGLA